MKTYSFPYDYKSVDVSIDERFVQGFLCLMRRRM